MEDPYIACTDNLRKMGINFVGIDFDVSAFALVKCLC